MREGQPDDNFQHGPGKTSGAIYDVPAARVPASVESQRATAVKNRMPGICNSPDEHKVNEGSGRHAEIDLPKNVLNLTRAKLVGCDIDRFLTIEIPAG